MGDPTIELLDNGQVLHLRNVRRSDKGRYQCAVSNAAGKQAKDVKLTVYSEYDFLMLFIVITSRYILKIRVYPNVKLLFDATFLCFLLFLSVLIIN